LGTWTGGSLGLARTTRGRLARTYRVLELAVAHDPVRYRDLVVNPQPKAAPPVPPGIRGHPPSMDRPRAARPWRASWCILTWV